MPQWRWPEVFRTDRPPRQGARRGAKARRAATRTRFELGRATRPAPARHVPWRGLLRGAATVAVLGTLAYGAAWIYAGDTLRVQRINVVGAQVVDPYEVATNAELDGASMLVADLGGAGGRIEALPGIASAEVTRDWPQGIRVTITEHEGWGYWQAAGRRVLVDASGLAHDLARPPASDAPTIIDIAAPEDLAAGVAIDADTVQLVARLLAEGVFETFDVAPAGYTFRRDRGLTVLFDEEPDVVFGDSTNFTFKVAAWGAAREQLAAEELVVSEIDLRFGPNLVLR